MSKLRDIVSNSQGEEVIVEWTKEEKDNLPPRYGCQILLENATPEQAQDPTFPTDAYLILYTVNGKDYMDLCRGCKKASIFDLYYDKFGPGAIRKITWGYGKVNPKTWGYKAPEKKRRK